MAYHYLILPPPVDDRRPRAYEGPPTDDRTAGGRGEGDEAAVAALEADPGHQVDLALVGGFFVDPPYG